MTTEEAKFILEARRPDGSDDSDPQVAEALAIAGLDPALKRWLEDRSGFDTAIAGKLAGLRPLAELRARILAGKQVSKPVIVVSFRAWLAVAAAIAVLLTVGLSLMRTRSTTVAEFGADSVRFVHEKWDHRFDLQESNIGRIRQWLADQKTGLQLDVPASVAGKKMYGCKVYEWNGRKATLVCFSADDGGTIHLVMTARDAMTDPPGETPVHFRQGDYNMAAWSLGSQVYVAMTQSPKAELEKIL